MSYKSPIEIVCGKMKNQLENDIYSVVQSYGIKVDKGELINALEYDRNQYKQGYADAKAELERKKGEWLLYESRSDIYDLEGVCTWGKAYRCSECGFMHWVIEDFGIYSFCPNCGADMRGE